MDGCRAIHEETYMMILLFSVLNDEQRALVERIFHEHHIHFQRISFNIVKSEEAAEDVVSTATFVRSPFARISEYLFLAAKSF